MDAQTVIMREWCPLHWWRKGLYLRWLLSSFSAHTLWEFFLRFTPALSIVVYFWVLPLPFMPNGVKHRLWALASSFSFVCLSSLVLFLFHRPLMRLFLRVWVGKHSKFSLPQHRSSKNPIAIDCSTGLYFGIVSAPRFGRRFWHGRPRSMNEYKSWCKHAQHEAFVVGARDKDIYCS